MPYCTGMSTTLTLTSKGQVTFKKDILAHLGVKPGDRIDVEMLPDGTIKAMPMRGTGKISDVFGMLRVPPGVHFTVDQLSGDYAFGLDNPDCD